MKCVFMELNFVDDFFCLDVFEELLLSVNILMSFSWDSFVKIFLCFWIMKFLFLLRKVLFLYVILFV